MIPDPIVLAVELSDFTSLALSFKDLVLLTPASVEFSELIFDFSTDVRCPSSFSKSSKRFVIWSKISPGFDPVTD